MVTEQVQHSLIIQSHKTPCLGIVETIHNYHLVIKMTRGPERPVPVECRNENITSRLPSFQLHQSCEERKLGEWEGDGVGDGGKDRR